ncbi:PKD-like family lipoprotein [Sphingobacterium sp. UT-1RO-CII-1]|uniref:PKD-like family lipoprotein n=1 Tax=Sphingobacterium sp. UT-1RO-CII-1 TaxID=2995225 RepID=UPI00227C9F00|nr:PKD-like family lipoprotein [Sphingobacterium sp. UT-1RO-CII-1]MCY4780733.1 PKD-like family lipoprotein [Sphingobacterium sp. UT-1RO-CII-1]
MKNIKNILKIGLNLFLLLVITSCKDDLSTVESITLPEIKVDDADKKDLTVFQFDRLQFEPKIVQEGSESDNLSYEWKINMEGRSIEYVVIGMDKKLDYEVNFPPTSLGYEHQVLLKVTDENTGIAYLHDWKLTIRNGIGEGLVIVETYDGQNTDLSHVMSPLVTPDFNEEKIRYKVFSSANAYPIEGLVNNLIYTQVKSKKSLLGSTNSSLFNIDMLDYQLEKRNEELYFVPQASYGADFLGTIVQNEVIIRDGKLFASWMELNNIGLPFTNNFKVPAIVGLNARYDYPTVVLNFYSEDLGTFVYQPALSTFGDREMKRVAAATGAFNPNSVRDHENLAAGVNERGEFIHLLRDKQNQERSLFILDGGEYDGDNGVVISPKPLRKISLADAPEIDQAILYVILPNQNVMLYATKTKIYGVVYGGSKPSFGVRYTAINGEEITSLKVFQQADYPKRSVWNDENRHFEKNNKQLILGTYTGSEGKVHILPLVNEGLANIDQKNIKTYNGFGRILFTTTQL